MALGANEARLEDVLVSAKKKVVYSFSLITKLESHVYYKHQSRITCSRREIANAAHIRSAEWPIVSLDVNSATAGNYIHQQNALL